MQPDRMSGAIVAGAAGPKQEDLGMLVQAPSILTTKIYCIILIFASDPLKL
jgi:hypothetical protein